MLVSVWDPSISFHSGQDRNSEQFGLVFSSAWSVIRASWPVLASTTSLGKQSDWSLLWSKLTLHVSDDSAVAMWWSAVLHPPHAREVATIDSLQLGNYSIPEEVIITVAVVIGCLKRLHNSGETSCQRETYFILGHTVFLFTLCALKNSSFMNCLYMILKTSFWCFVITLVARKL